MVNTIEMLVQMAEVDLDDNIQVVVVEMVLLQLSGKILK